MTHDPNHRPQRRSAWGDFLFGSPYRTLALAMVLLVSILAVWSIFDQTTVQRLIDNAWALVVHLISLAVTVGMVGLGIWILLGRPGRKKKPKH